MSFWKVDIFMRLPRRKVLEKDDNLKVKNRKKTVVIFLLALKTVLKTGNNITSSYETILVSGILY